MRFFNTIQWRALAGVLVSLAIFLLPLVVVFAYDNTAGGQYDNTAGGQYDNSAGGSTYLQNPLGVNSFCQLIKVVLNAALVIGLPIAVLFIVYAGFKFVLARGNPGELEAARSNLLYTLIGIAIFIGASLIASVIIGTLAQLGVNNISSC